MRELNSHLTDSVASSGGDRDTKVMNPSKLLAAATDENRRLVAENRILWDLLLYDGFGLDTSKLECRCGVLGRD